MPNTFSQIDKQVFARRAGNFPSATGGRSINTTTPQQTTTHAQLHFMCPEDLSSNMMNTPGTFSKKGKGVLFQRLHRNNCHGREMQDCLFGGILPAHREPTVCAFREKQKQRTHH